MATYTLRPMTMGEILDTAIAVYRKFFGTLMSIAIVCLGVPTVLSIYVTLGGGPVLRPGIWLVAVLLQWAGGIVAEGAMVWAISEAYLGHDPMTGDALGYAFGRFGRIFVAGFAKYLLIGLATLLFLVPGIIVACGYAVVIPAVVLENMKSGTDALGRSWSLTTGFKGKAFGLGVVVLLLVYVPAGIAEAIAGAMPVLRSMFLTLGQLIQLAVMPALGCVFTLFYYDLRVRKEAFDLEQLSTHMGTTGRARAAPA